MRTTIRAPRPKPFTSKRAKKKEKMIKIIAMVGISVVAILIVVAILLANGVIWFNNPSEKRYPIQGVSLSSHQGEVDWKVLANQKKQPITFAYIKATEGSKTVDERFQFNWENAHTTKLEVGAYHFFNFDSTAEAQAENFIKTVPVRGDAMPPAVDIELYGEYKKNPPDKESVQKELSALLSKLEEHYGKMPVIYATQESFDRYISGSFKEYSKWIRDVLKKPKLSDDRGWVMWQYSDHQKLDGYKGEEKFIDMNVFSSTKTAFKRWIG